MAKPTFKLDSMALAELVQLRDEVEVGAQRQDRNGTPRTSGEAG